MTKSSKSLDAIIAVENFIFDNYKVIFDVNHEYKTIVFNTYKKLPPLIGNDYDKHLNTVADYIIDNPLPIPNINYVFPTIHSGTNTIDVIVLIKKDAGTFERMMFTVFVHEDSNE